ncbi:hypothetical protein MAPG_03688 [Magnaporthiopsis poae ATCC 64411]|uniref:Uncharacterized protein n=1 Tax=Magnaporthiopsis poae (strain ATCC 64411 / 73-15) TaxID=644358 RepID=A0A0C4DUP6_MAGP6|nr:hypothetical protein MAPG_03688 [Magnaporthiopsis poae ATCC 64411]
MPKTAPKRHTVRGGAGRQGRIHSCPSGWNRRIYFLFQDYLGRYDAPVCQSPLLMRFWGFVRPMFDGSTTRCFRPAHAPPRRAMANFSITNRFGMSGGTGKTAQAWLAGGHGWVDDTNHARARTPRDALLLGASPPTNRPASHSARPTFPKTPVSDIQSTCGCPPSYALGVLCRNTPSECPRDRRTRVVDGHEG